MSFVLIQNNTIQKESLVEWNLCFFKAVSLLADSANYNPDISDRSEKIAGANGSWVEANEYQVFREKWENSDTLHAGRYSSVDEVTTWPAISETDKSTFRKYYFGNAFLETSSSTSSTLDDTSDYFSTNVFTVLSLEFHNRRENSWLIPYPSNTSNGIILIIFKSKKLMTCHFIKSLGAAANRR